VGAGGGKLTCLLKETASAGKCQQWMHEAGQNVTTEKSLQNGDTEDSKEKKEAESKKKMKKVVWSIMVSCGPERGENETLEESVPSLRGNAITPLTMENKSRRQGRKET